MMTNMIEHSARAAVCQHSDVGKGILCVSGCATDTVVKRPACSSMDDARYISPSVVINGGKDMDGPYGIPEIAKLIEERQKFRAIQDWEKADKIRSTLEAMGFSVQDSCSGVTTLGKTEEKNMWRGQKMT